MYNFKGRLDEKNRMTIPADLRHEFEGTDIIITPGFKDYLHLYTEKVWKEEMERALGFNNNDQAPIILNEELADLNDRFLSDLVVTRIDAKRGRVTLDQNLLEHAGMDRARDWVAVRMPAGNGSYWRVRRADRNK